MCSGKRLLAVAGRVLGTGSLHIDSRQNRTSDIDLPVVIMLVQAPTKYDLAINLKTAKALGLTVPDKVLAIANEVIE